MAQSKRKKQDESPESGESVDLGAIRSLRELKAAGMDEHLAEVLVEVMMRWMSSNLASKADIKRLEFMIEQLRSDTQKFIAVLEANTKKEIADSERRQSTRLFWVNGSSAVAIVTVLSAVIVVVGWLFGGGG